MKNKVSNGNKESLPIWLKASLAIVGILLLASLIWFYNLKNTISRADAENMAVNEAKRISQNAWEHEKADLYLKGYSAADVAATEQAWQQDTNSIYAIYSTKQGDAWHIYLGQGHGTNIPVEVIVYSRDNIQIPQLEAALRNGTALNNP